MHTFQSRVLLELAELRAEILSTRLDIHASREAIVSDIDDLNQLVADLQAEADATQAQNAEVIVTLNELKALIQTGNIHDAVVKLEAIKSTLQGTRGQLDAAEEAVDPTPDTPPTP